MRRRGYPSFCPITQSRHFYAKKKVAAVAAPATGATSATTNLATSANADDRGVSASSVMSGFLDKLRAEQKQRVAATTRRRDRGAPSVVPVKGEEQWQFRPKVLDLNQLSVGDDANAGGMDFSDLELAVPRPLRKRIEAYRQNHSITHPTPAQTAALGPIFEGRDVVCVAPPGSGKTLAYLIPPLAAFTETTLDNFGNVPSDSRRKEATQNEIRQQVKERGKLQCRYCGHDMTEVSMCVETGLPHPPPEKILGASGERDDSGRLEPGSAGPRSATPFLIVLAPRNEVVLQVGQVVKDLTRGMEIKVVVLQRSVLNGWSDHKTGENLGEDPEDGNYDPHTGDRVHPMQKGAGGFNYTNPCKDGCDVLIGTPTQVFRMLRKRSVTLTQIKTIVMDELDEYFTWSHYETTMWLLSMLPKSSVRRPQRLWFGATCPPLVMKHLGPKEGTVDANVRFITGTAVDESTKRRTRDSNIRHHVEMLSPTERYNRLRSFFSMPQHVAKLARDSEDFNVFARWNRQLGSKGIHFEPSEKVLIFVNNLSTLMELRSFLAEHFAKPESMALYGRELQVNTLRPSDPEEQRIFNLKCFNRRLIDAMPKIPGDEAVSGQTNVIDVLLVTSSVGRGVHFDSVKYAVLYDMPESIVDYEHHAGRVARGLGDEGVVVSYFCPHDSHLATDLAYHLKKSAQAVPSSLQALADMSLAEKYTKLVAPAMAKRVCLQDQPELNKYHTLPVKGKDFPKYVPQGHFVQLMRQWKESTPRHLPGEAEKIRDNMVD